MVEKSELKCGTDTLIYAVQEQALRTNSVKPMINKTQASSFCRTYQEKTESVTHIVNACANLAKNKYRKRHDKVAKKIISFSIRSTALSVMQLVQPYIRSCTGK